VVRIMNGRPKESFYRSKLICILGEGRFRPLWKTYSIGILFSIAVSASASLLRLDLSGRLGRSRYCIERRKSER
jgi:hypothetical protein